MNINVRHDHYFHILGLDALGDRIVGAIEARLGQLEIRAMGALDDIKADLAAAKDELANTVARLDEQNTALAAANQKLVGVNTGLDRIEALVRALIERVGAGGSDGELVQQIADAARELRATVATAAAEVDETAAGVATTAAETGAIEEDVARTEAAGNEAPPPVPEG